jgi:molybdenum cofactor cytidylyltransferase
MIDIGSEMRGLGAVLLAAGASRRFGPDCKLLANIGGEAMVRRVARALTQSDLADIVVVTGHEERQCRDALQGLAVRLVHNHAWNGGMGTSIAMGVAALGQTLDGAFIVPGDMPFLRPALLKTMAGLFSQSEPPSIVFPATPDGEQRNPVLWPRRFFPRLLSLSGQGGAKAILQESASQSAFITVDDPSELLDIDTPTELAAARAILGKSHR